MAARTGSLKHYRLKRDFSKTPEPEPVQEAGSAWRYLIQKHAATRLHYDFRLELDGVLKSWAVTRGPSLDPHDKRLAVEVEDHPVAYGSFEGIIPKGQYGGGTVMLWDTGTWEPIGDPHKGLEEGKLEFNLHGKRLKGEWTLVRMRPREQEKNKKGGERHNWLLIKHSDDAARIGDNGRFLQENTTSVVSRRSMEKIAAAGDSVWQSGTATPAAKPVKKTGKPLPALPPFIPPQLATLSEEVPQGGEWVHEIKFDGYRILAYVENGQARMSTRNGKDWTEAFSAIATALAPLPVQNAILDGEIIAADDKGVSNFKMLKDALGAGEYSRLQYYVFDLLYLDGKKLTGMPLLERKALLEPLLKDFTARIFYSEHFSSDDAHLLQHACELRLEGIVSKRRDAPYSSGRGRSWLKTKCHLRQEFVIGGFTLPSHEGPGIGALLLGVYEKGKLVYAGRVGTGFDHATSRQLRQALEPIVQPDAPFASVPVDGRRGARWVKPQLACEVEFTEWTQDGRLRHPSFQGLREDKPPERISRDRPVAAPKAKAAGGKDAEVGGIRISHPGRILYPGTDITKQQLAEYYLAVADHILPHIAGRPLSTIRCPEGSGEPCFFQRHITRGQSPYLHETGIAVKGKERPYMMIKDKNGLLTLVQWGVIELHPWGCLADKPELPDRIIFDLDPDPAVAWAQVIEGVREVRARMQEFGLQSFVKTTGGKGLHVTIPIKRGYGWATVKAFARAVAKSMEHDSPGRYIATASKEARKGKIFVDYLRNELTATAVAPFSARARENATVATPLAWAALKASPDPREYTIATVPQRLKRLKADPWEGFFQLKQSLPARHLRALKIEP